MVKRHLKSLNAPRTWKIQRRATKFVTRSNPGGMPKDFTLPLSNILKYDLKLADSIKEVKSIVFNEQVLVNGRRVCSYNHPVCFTDVLSLPKINVHYRIIIDRDNVLKPIAVSKEESVLKIVKIIGKSFVKGTTQLNLSDGRNLFFEKHHYKVGDSLLLTLPEQIVKEHLPMEKGMFVLLYKGNHVGKIGMLQGMKQDSIVVKTGDADYETLKDYLLVVGKDKPLIKMTK